MDNDNIVSAPVFRSLLFPPMIAGIPRNIFIALLGITAIYCLAYRQYWFLIIGLLAFFLFRFMTKIDIYFFDIYLSLMKLPEVLD